MKTAAALLALLILNPMLALAETESYIVIVPDGTYVQSDNPPCGVTNSVLEIGSDPTVAAGVSSAFGPVAAAVVVGISKADAKAMEHGGELAKLWNSATGRNDTSSCATFCIRLPEAAIPTQVRLSNRGSSGYATYPFHDGVIVSNMSTQDWSGWRDVVSAYTDGRYMVCGTATNWDNARSATKTIAIDYSRGISQSPSEPEEAYIDLTRYCQVNYGIGFYPALNGDTAYDWSCTNSNGAGYGMDIIAGCNQQYGLSTAKYQDFYDPYSWYCE